MTQYNPYQAPAAPLTEVATEVAPSDAAAVPIGGWLYLVGFAMVVSPFMMLAQLRETFVTFVTNGAWAQLTTPGAEAYHPFWGTLIVSETAINVLLIATVVYLNYLFFSKRKAFPKWYIRTQLGTLAYLIADALAVHAVRPDLPLLNAETGKDMVQAAFSVCVWVPYMRLSDRVKRTFVRS